MTTSRFRRSIFSGAIAAGLLVGATAVAGAVTAQTTPSTAGPSRATTTPVAESQSESTTESAATEAQDASALQSRATITSDQAGRFAADANPGATINGVTLGDEDGTVIYEVAMTDSKGAAIDVKVDATDGTVLGQDSAELETSTGADHQNDGEEVGEDGNGAVDAADSAEAPAAASAG